MKKRWIQTTIAPWLTVRDGEEAAKFYKAAFDAVETYRLETPDGLIGDLLWPERNFGSVVVPKILLLLNPREAIQSG